MRPRSADQVGGYDGDGADGDAGWSAAVFGADAEDRPAARRSGGAGRYFWLGAAVSAGVAAGVALSISPPSRQWFADAGQRIVTAVDRRPVHELRVLDLAGHARVAEEQVADAAGLAPEGAPAGRHALMLDAAATRAKIEALPWVARAEVTFRAPDTLVVRIAERRAAAVWRQDRRLTLLDDGGEAIVDLSGAAERRRDWASLPLIVGEGAAERLGEALSLIGRAEEAGLAPAALTRVGRRRWDLKLVDGPVVLMPEAEPEMALETVIAWARSADLLRRPFSRIDLRSPHAPTARLVESTTAAPQ